MRKMTRRIQFSDVQVLILKPDETVRKDLLENVYHPFGKSPDYTGRIADGEHVLKEEIKKTYFKKFFMTEEDFLKYATECSTNVKAGEDDE